MRLPLPTPDQTTLSRRARSSAVRADSRASDSIHLVVDATGLKVLGQGEWATWRHGVGRRRGWKKLHLGIDRDGFIAAADVTDAYVPDGGWSPVSWRNWEAHCSASPPTGPTTVVGLRSRSRSGTCAPHRRASIEDRGVSGEARLAQRDAAVLAIQRNGRRRWKKDAGYRQQARGECAIGCYKRTFGRSLRARRDEAQRREVSAACAVLNRMLELGRPKSYAVVNS